MVDQVEPKQTEDTEGEVSIVEYIAVLLEGWPWILGVLLLGILYGIYAAWSQAAVYQASSLVRIEQQGGASQALPLSGEFGPKSSVSAESAVLKSRSILGAAVERVNLQVDAIPDYWGDIGKFMAIWRGDENVGSAPLGLLPKYAWGGERISISKLLLPEGADSGSFRVTAGKNGNYNLSTTAGIPITQGQVGVSAAGLLPSGGRIEIRIDELRARPGTRFIARHRPRNSAIGSLNGRLSVSEAARGSSILRLTLRGASPSEAERQLNAVMEVYLEANVEKQSEQASQRLQFLKEQLPELRQQRDAVERRLRDFQESAGLLDLDSEANNLLSRLTSIDQALEELKFQRQELLRRYTVEHPSIEAVDSKLAQLRSERRKYSGEVKALPKAQSKLLELQRDVQVSNRLYLQLLNQAQELEIARAGITGFIQILDRAYSPPGKVAPKRKQIVMLYALVGLLLGATLVVLRHYLRSTIREPDDLENRTGLPVYASIPFSSTENKLHDADNAWRPLALVDGEDLAIESLRSFRTSMQFALMEAKGGRIAFTGPTPECGKSFVSMNVAVLLAQSGKSVALVDADLRRGRLRKSFNIPKGYPGLSECMSGEARLDDALVDVDELSLSVLTSGRYPPNPSELLMSPKLHSLLSELDQKYDYVIYDLPPVLNVADATIVAHMADAVFMVVRAERSTLHDVQEARKRLNRDDTSLKGLLFNGFKPNRLRYGYARYGYYSYKYKASN